MCVLCVSTYVCVWTLAFALSSACVSLCTRACIAYVCLCVLCVHKCIVAGAGGAGTGWGSGRGQGLHVEAGEPLLSA